jgi:hypothetical protein
MLAGLYRPENGQDLPTLAGVNRTTVASTAMTA